mgnify:CR=1 FL=1
MYEVRGYCAGILVFAEVVQRNELNDFLKDQKELLEGGKLTIRFGTDVTQTATELCVDVYDKETGAWRSDLSRAFKK